MSIIRKDSIGLYIRIAGRDMRPGAITGWDHVYDMSDGNLNCGDKVRAYHIAGTNNAKLFLDDGSILVWSADNS